MEKEESLGGSGWCFVAGKMVGVGQNRPATITGRSVAGDCDAWLGSNIDGNWGHEYEIGDSKDTHIEQLWRPERYAGQPQVNSIAHPLG